ncbi:hypothetical protein HO133_009220 [Letharia lupina]|uniref:Uncharacterized protein n=1 Tax=Letharia lupina TaxID=560253 RepID=A0A8H6FFW1_9LECA|nr:uncharacterized protein HO133_009220 [Letharia lupina]KAF6226354.1 hypothetical protein HO133_009220 [Letharia lupina]
MHATIFEDRPSCFFQRHAITAIFEEVASENPEKLALVSRCGTLSYAGLNERVNQLARHLRSLGIGLECVVAVALERGIEYVVAMLASWKIGATYLPLDQSLPAKRMQYMMSDSGTSCLVTVKKIIEEKSLKLKAGTTLCLDEEELIDRLRACPSADISSVAYHDNLAYIIYTSGTTGNPKGVAITHGSVFNLVDDIRQSREIEPSDRVLLFSPFCFDASIRDINGALVLGASLYVPEEEEILPSNLVKTIAQHRITNSVITPSVLRTCTLEHLPDFKTIVLAGEAADASLIRTWGAGRKLINAYGPTEATVCSTKRVYYDGQIPSGCSASVIGNPILNTIISILDDDDIPVKHGEVGEICVTGPGVSRPGYLNMPQLNADRFRDDSFCQCRSYKTRDLGRILPNGEVECLGRKACTRQIKLNGQRIEPEEVENVIRSAFNVLDVVVISQGVATTCSLCAYVVPAHEGSTVNREALTAHLKELMRKNLPSYSIPSVIEVIDALPLSANKKLDIKALSDPAFKKVRCFRSSRETLLTPLEKKIAAALLEALDLPTEQAVSPGTTYGELGGSSLQASLVLRRLNGSIGCKIQFGQFYRRDISIRHLADLILGEQQQQASPPPDDLLKRTILPRDIVYNLEEANITGTIEILRFASTLTQKRLTYISTLAVFFGIGNKIHCGIEVPVNNLQSGIVTGYAQSKWVSEQLVLEYARLGGHALVLRPGRLLGSTWNYKCPRDDFTIRLIASILEMGVAPNFDDIGGKSWQIDLTPVDFCARLAHRFSLQKKTGIRHIINKETISFEAIVKSLGEHIQRMPYRQWLQLVTQSAHLAPLSSLFHEPVSDQDSRSVFEVLLQTKIFRYSSYEAIVPKDDTDQLPLTIQLLNNYLEGNLDIFSNSRKHNTPSVWN